ncbi:hypothetical protein [Campylobacter concisus]|uniref:hypothetical protein n=1 Tax=Campylobacter concisus TaxID=199 RepID=UPI0011E89F4D|nr:hypothetical protein [Campylobacter concisus]
MSARQGAGSRRNLTPKSRIFSVCGRKIEAVWGAKLALKGAEATLAKRAKNVGARLADANGQNPQAVFLAKNKTLPNRKAVNLIRPREVIKMPL